MTKKKEPSRHRFTNIEKDVNPDLGRRGEDLHGEGHPRRGERYTDNKPERKKTFPDPKTQKGSRREAGFQYGQEGDALHYGNLGSGSSSHATRLDPGRQQRSGVSPGPHRGKGPKNYHRPDERIYDDINEQLTDSDDVDAYDISVDVHGGDVVLSGTVGDRQSKRLAADIADGVKGVTNVENRIRIRPPDRSAKRESETGSIRSNINETTK